MPYQQELIKVFVLTAVSFIVAFFGTPLLTSFLYRNKIGKQIRSDGSTPVFSKLHASKKGTPTMGGILIWMTALLIALSFWFLDRVVGISELRILGSFSLFHDLNFLTRSETWLPLGAFIGASMVGLLDDFLDVRSMGYKGRGIQFRFKVILYAIVASIGAWWFYAKLGFDTIHIPLFGDWVLGALYIPFFILVVVGTSFAVNQTDGLDGLAGGTLLASFVAYGFIAFLEHKFNLSALAFVVAGALVAFLWFNIYPARFFMGDTGSMGMGVLLATMAFLTNTSILLIFFGFIFVIEAFSSLLQMFWRFAFGRKLLISSPLHHHLEALGWPETKVTMRFWIIAWVVAIIGMIIYFLDR